MKLDIPPFDQARVLVVGDVMLDRYWHGPTGRISPEAPVPVVRVEQIEERPGGAANVGVNIAALGASARVLGLTGDDEAADTLAAQCKRLGVDTDFLRLRGRPTITKLRVLSRNQQLIRLDFEDGFPGFNPHELQQRFADFLPEADLVLLSEYGKGALRDVQYYIAAARAAGKPVLVDPKGRDFTPYRGATLIKPNFSEFEAIVGRCETDAELVEKGNRLREDLDVDALLVTRSEKGMSLLTRGEEPLHIPTRAREVFDVTGAGDTVIAIIASALAAGVDLPKATALANIGASIVVSKIGTASVTATELRRAIEAHEKPLRGVLVESELVVAIEQARARNETVVMTNGCFDILHAGHVAYLEEARRLGDRLVVALNTDDSVRRLKGEHRPVNSVENRMRVIAGLAAVDWVVSFSEDTPERIICELKPDYLVKGGDHDLATIVGGDCVRAAGGQVVSLDFLDGHSTTSTIANIQGRA